jgi:all-trans-retinol 13,14-reductase
MNLFMQTDILILGSGLGGLVCGAILSKKGYSVCVIEKNKQIGGNLQTYVRDKIIFDSGVHYIGGLDKGQNLYQVFKYLGIMNKLKLERMNLNAFDKIVFDGDGNEYPVAQGYDNFIKQLLIYFPEEEKALQHYCETVQDICSKFPMYNLRMGKEYNEKAEVLEINAKDFIASITNNKKLQNVLAGNNFLYAGIPNKTPFYVHALIINSYIQSAWKCIDGGSQIGKYLAKTIRENGGEIKRNSRIKNIVEQDGKIDHIVLENGETIKAKQFISNIHPAQTFAMLDSKLIRQAYRKKIVETENSVGSFTLNIVLKPQTFSYLNQNYYVHNNANSVWQSADYTQQNWPLSYCLYISPSSKSKKYAEAISILTYMRYDEVKEWENTFNTVPKNEYRGESYELFKKTKAEKLLAEVYKKFPDLKQAVANYYVSTPLTFRDYIGTSDGSMYGMAKDHKDPLMTFMPTRTKIPNLYLTGQNLAMHGILGVTITALATCANFTDIEQLLHKINNA